MQHLIKKFVFVIFLGSHFFLLAQAQEPTLKEENPIRTRELLAVKDIPQTLEFTYDIGEIAIGNPSIASVVVDRLKKRIIISPLTPGGTALLVFDTAGKQRDTFDIVVTSTNLDQFVQDLSFLFRDIEGLQFRRVGSKVVIEGEVYLKADLDRIQEVIKGNEFVVNLVTLSQDTRRLLAKRIRDEIGIQGVEVATAKEKIILKGEVGSEEESKRAEKIAQIYVDKDTLVNVISVNPRRSQVRASKMIQVSAHFVELNKSFLRNFNFSWTPIATTTFAAGVQDGKAFVNLLAVVTEFLPKLNTAKALGVARVFENPTVAVKSGETANIEAGQQLLFPSTNPQGDINFGGDEKGKPVNVGVTLNVTPTADERNFVDMKVSVRVAKLGASNTDKIVLINNSTVSTSNYVRTGETVAIGGVLRSSFSDIKDAPPGQTPTFAPGPGFTAQSTLGNIFQVFKSRNIFHDRTMFIVFITPEILISARDAGRTIRESMHLNSVEQRNFDLPQEFE